MRIMVASDNRSMAMELQEHLKGCSIGPSDLLALSLEEATDRVVQFRPEMIVVVLSPNPEPALTAVREMHAMLSTHILVIGPGTDPQLILRALREGASQYVDEAETLHEIATSLKRLSLDTPRQSEPGRLITVLGPSGGSGGSTLSVNLAAALASKYERCALFDLKLETGDLATLLDIEPEHTIADFCRNMPRMDQVMFAQCFARHKCGIHLLASPNHYSEVEDVTARGVRKALSMARSQFPFVIVDLDHSYRGPHAQALFQADVVILVMQLDFTSLRQSRRVLNYLHEVGIERNRIQLVVNRYRRPKELPVSEVEETLGLNVRFLIPDDPRCINQANNKGVPVVLDQPRAKSSKRLIEIAWSVNGRA